MRKNRLTVCDKNRVKKSKRGLTVLYQDDIMYKLTAREAVTYAPNMSSQAGLRVELSKKQTKK